MSVTEVHEAVEELDERAKALLGEGHRLLPLNANGGVTNNVVVKSGQGLVYGFTVYNSNASSQFIAMFAGTVVPANGAVPIMVFPVTGKSNRAVDFGVHGRAFRQGLIVTNSSTDTTLTIGAADCIFDVQYV